MSTTGSPPAEDVVLLDEQGRFAGTMRKSSVHHTDTPLHLAFSSYLFRADGAVLLTRRAEHKQTWPGVLTNSCCGHPLPGEDLAEAVRRRLLDELGMTVGPVELILPRFRYRARMSNGVVENELCPVFRAISATEPRPNPAETGWAGWADWDELVDAVRGGTREVSPWCREQLEQLNALGPDPLGWPTADVADLPEAARESTV